MKTGVIGLGAMGAPMARNLHRAGLLAAVWNRSAATADALGDELGVAVAVAESPADLAARSEAIILSVSADEDVLEVLDSLLPGLQEGSIVIDTSTVRGETARAAAGLLAKAGAAFLDAPVSGGIEGARKGEVMLPPESPTLSAISAGNFCWKQKIEGLPSLSIASRTSMRASFLKVGSGRP